MLRVHAKMCCEKEVELIFMSASKPMFLNSHLFSLIFLGLVFYVLRPGKQNTAQLTVMDFTALPDVRSAYLFLE